MCGICGIIGETEGKEQVLSRMMKALKHRGPDGRDSYITRDQCWDFKGLVS